MLRNGQLLTAYDFSGGINLKDPRHLIADNELSADIAGYEGTRNTYWRDMEMKKRAGSTLANIDDGADLVENGIRFYRDAAPTKTTVLALSYTGETRLKYLNGTTLTNLPGGTALDEGVEVYFASWKNKLYVTSGNQVIQVISYVGAWSRNNIVGLAYKPQYICQHKDRIWAAGGDMPMGYFECSDYDDAEEWASGNGEAFYAGLQDGDPIKQLMSFGDNLVIYKQDSIWTMRGDNLYNWFEHRDEPAVGCWASKSVADVSIGHIFLGPDNVYFFNAERIIPIGDNIKPWLDMIPATYRPKVAAIYHDGFYRLAFSSSTYNNYELWFDVFRYISSGYRIMAWWLMTGRNINAYVKYDGPGDNNQIFMCDSDDGYLRQLESGITDDSVSIIGEMLGKYQGMGQPNIEKIFDRIKVDVGRNIGRVYVILIKGLGGDSLKQYALNTGEAEGVWGTGEWGEMEYTAGGDQGRFTADLAIPANMDGPVLAVKFKHSEDIIGARFHGYSLLWAQKAF